MCDLIGAIVERSIREVVTSERDRDRLGMRIDLRLIKRWIIVRLPSPAPRRRYHNDYRRIVRMYTLDLQHAKIAQERVTTEANHARSADRRARVA